jgi:hypothetical protein
MVQYNLVCGCFCTADYCISVNNAIFEYFATVFLSWSSTAVLSGVAADSPLMNVAGNVVFHGLGLTSNSQSSLVMGSATALAPADQAEMPSYFCFGIQRYPSFLMFIGDILPKGIVMYPLFFNLSLPFFPFVSKGSLLACISTRALPSECFFSFWSFPFPSTVLVLLVYVVSLLLLINKGTNKWKNAYEIIYLRQSVINTMYRQFLLYMRAFAIS